MSIAKLKIIFDKEADGRHIAEVPSLPGVMAYGATKAEAKRKVSAIALRTLADRVEQTGARGVVSQLFAYGSVAGR
ncbi:MAG: type II toxin-antitoxin system HicB family antitoxin [Candidatus Pacebacteria bacterium]|jgi:predicted RNase H-like HicB family nuclease|nr:type II toxin-antitoxin system HicB family antitoxin [Candidatus Paceibacterota bacterium]